MVVSPQCSEDVLLGVLLAGNRIGALEDRRRILLELADGGGERVGNLLRRGVRELLQRCEAAFDVLLDVEGDGVRDEGVAGDGAVALVSVVIAATDSRKDADRECDSDEVASCPLLPLRGAKCRGRRCTCGRVRTGDFPGRSTSETRLTECGFPHREALSCALLWRRD